MYVEADYRINTSGVDGEKWKTFYFDARNFETEYRTDISKNGFWGAVFFTNLSSVSKLDTYDFKNWSPTAGAGLRIKWNKQNNSNLVLDFGVSKNDWSLRLGLAENF
ncbi:hypothetical protein [Flavobacterium sp. CSZ]|uniref:hypothetical protein n=1 Tax=Flavobacterium sp. CSZ TaxID=2783791 RepID=UPI001E415AD6|nr:hypothetical protein [Flavobacterium sp. CSZ]